MTANDFREWIEQLETQTLTEQLKLDILEEFNQFLEDLQEAISLTVLDQLS